MTEPGPSERAYDLAWARGCRDWNECWYDCAEAAQFSLCEGLDDGDKALLADYDETQRRALSASGSDASVMPPAAPNAPSSSSNNEGERSL